MESFLEIIWAPALAVWGFMTVFYVISRVQNDGGLADTAWGLGFVLISTVLLLNNDDPSSLQTLLHILVTVWGVRLATHIFTRNLGRPEDKRYAQWREDWGDTYWWRSYLQIFMLQGFLMLVVSAPVYAATLRAGAISLGAWAYIGLALWLVGFFFEAVGDWQLRQFIKDKKTKGKIMRYGVWKYTRHPNYFGEVAMWWGLFIAVIGAPYWYLAAIGPITISYLLLYVSGIPMLEKKWDDNKEYQEYKKVTSPLIPMPPKNPSK